MKLSLIFSALETFWVVLRQPESLWQKVTQLIYAGRGKSVEVTIQETAVDVLTIRIQNKIQPGGVKNGKLVAITREFVIPHGGKRMLEIPMTYETAMMLHSALGAQLHRLRRRIIFEHIRRKLEGVLAVLADFKHHKLPE